MNAVTIPSAKSTTKNVSPFDPAFMAASRTISLDQNPLKIGTPAMEIHPQSIVQPVTGIFLSSPPMRRMSSVPVQWMTDPEQRNRRPLKNAWFSMWKTPAR